MINSKTVYFTVHLETSVDIFTFKCQTCMTILFLCIFKHFVGPTTFLSSYTTLKGSLKSLENVAFYYYYHLNVITFKSRLTKLFSF